MLQFLGVGRMTHVPDDNCKWAELHLMGRIQSSGALIVIDRNTQTICACSENTLVFFGKYPKEILHKNCKRLFTHTQMEALFRMIDTTNGGLHQIQQDYINNKQVTIFSHSRDDIILVEVEHCQPNIFLLALVITSLTSRSWQKLTRPTPRESY